MRRAVAEILTWTVRRCRFRANEVIRESDANSHGVATILRWLAQDRYVFEQKFTTLAQIFPSMDSSPEFQAIGGQLRRLEFRCREILMHGDDPGESQPFGFTMPRITVESPLTSGQRFRRHYLIQPVSGQHEQAEAIYRFRFELAGAVLMQVAKWIDERGFENEGFPPTGEGRFPAYNPS